MQDVELVIGIANSVIFLCGGFVTLLARRAYLRTGLVSLHALALGLGIVTAGALVGGVIFHTTQAVLSSAIAVQSTISAIGFTVLAYSLYLDAETSIGEGDDDTASILEGRTN